MRSFTVPLPTLFAGFVAVLVGYASSAAIIWQAAAAAGAAVGQAERELEVIAQVGRKLHEQDK